MVQEVVETIHVEIAASQQRQQHASIDIARPRSHHQALERGVAHAGLGRSAELDRARARTVAEMQRDQSEVIQRALEKLCSDICGVLVRDAVESIATDPVFDRDVLVDRIGRCSSRHSRVESGVEHRDVGNVGQRCRRSVDRNETERVVHRGIGDMTLDGSNHRRIDQLRLLILASAVDHSMAHSVDPMLPQ